MAIVCGILGSLFVGAAYAAAPSTSVTDSHNKHNLSVYRQDGTNPTRSTVEERVCIFCHTPHHASEVTPLWSRFLSVASYTPYNSSTLKVSAAPGQPTGVSRLCLSCHDGTI
ncbi:MAG: cytochrome C, partial [Gemmatimonadetes bacterium]|nr:cytochrome C [Gemmatimonadota bacterium]NIT66291.1 cytochrome C [Gemmatimonadota bacterium]NIY34868.1 cytochrome C [Gemmatimonadota bacterium]